jgi:diguanylate cyclase (GGDEF)-like protein
VTRTAATVSRCAGIHLAPVLRRSSFAAYWWTLVAFGAVATILALTRTALGDPVAAGRGLWLLFGFVLVAELRPVIASNRTDPEGMNLATAFLFAVLLRWGPELTVLAVVVSTVVGEVARRKPVYRGTFNVAQYVVSYAAAWAVLWVGGWTASGSEPVTLSPDQLPLIALAAATYHLVNLVIVGTALSLHARTPWWASVTDSWWWYTRTTLSVVALSPLVVVILDVHEGFLPLLALPLALLWATGRYALEREERSQTDPLTGVANRDHLEELLDGRLRTLADLRHANGGTSDHRLGFCVLDLDRFKEVNDTLGHATGDELLRATADRLRHATHDAVARLGGDEFVVLLDLPPGADPLEVARALAAEIHAPYEVAGVRLEVELSLGLAIAPDDGGDLETLLRRADAAMYDAKSNGEVARSFRPELDRAPRSLELLTDLRRGIAAGELEVHYQPQVALPSGDVIGVEALVRWRHPTRGLVQPDEFLPLLERTATMRLLTVDVLERVASQAAAWRAAGLRVPVSLNTSLHDLADRGFADRVLAELARHGLDPCDLVIEITEQALVGDAQVVQDTLRALRAAGVALSLDDFGTGHASLTRLARLPVSEVKLDRQFLVDLELGVPEVVAIVRSAIELAHAIGARAVAEGIETSRQWELLHELGCDAVQGWLVAAAMPAWEASTWLCARAGSRSALRPEGPAPRGAPDASLAPSGDRAGDR